MIEFTVPIRTISEANVMEHWTKRHKRHKEQAFILKSFLNRHVLNVQLPVKIIITRIAPRQLDEHDNLRIALKHIIDSIGSHILPGLAPGRADGDKRLQWAFNQEKGKPREYAIRISIIPMPLTTYIVDANEINGLIPERYEKWRNHTLSVESTKAIRGY